jgi:hypothetical protein
MLARQSQNEGERTSNYQRKAGWSIKEKELFEMRDSIQDGNEKKEFFHDFDQDPTTAANIAVWWL